MKALRFLNLLSADGSLSLTNLAVVIGLVKMALAAQMSSTDAVALIGILGNYAHKRATVAGQDEA